MARIWAEPYSGQSGPPMEYWGTTPHPKNVLMVHVASFTFHFFSSAQIRDYLAYYSQRTHPSSRVSVGSADHWEVQRWFERLPMYLLEESKRVKVVKALERALKVPSPKACSAIDAVALLRDEVSDIAVSLALSEYSPIFSPDRIGA